MSRKCSFCKSTEHSACNCTSPLLLNCLAKLCEQYNYIVTNIPDGSMTKNIAIIFANNAFKQFLYQIQRHYNNILNVLVRNLRLTSRLTPYATSCLLIIDYISARTQRENLHLPIIYGCPIMTEEFFMINRIPQRFEAPELAYYKDFILYHDNLKIIMNLKFKQSIPLEIEHVFMMETEVLEDCPICMNTINASDKVMTNCNHNYCNPCFDKMVQHSRTINDKVSIKCAMCRSNITKCYKPIVSLV